MRVGVIGAGHIGGNVAERLAAAGHEIVLAGREPPRLEAAAAALGGRAATPSEAVAASDVVVVAVPWSAWPGLLDAIGSFDGRIVVDTTNQFGDGPMPAAGQTAAAFNAGRLSAARYVKTFNTLTAAFQRAAPVGREGRDRVVQWLAGDDAAATAVVAGLVRDAGYAPVDLGGTAGCAVMEAPRRPGAVYGEGYRLADAEAVVAAVREGRPIPPSPSGLR